MLLIQEELFEVTDTAYSVVDLIILAKGDPVTGLGICIYANQCGLRGCLSKVIESDDAIPG